jgi:putative FmdB family regulatory protein
MPLYEYECLKTGKRFEKIQKFSDPILTDCPDADCDSKVRKILSAPAIKFKGAGWYVNDYGKGGKLPPKDGDSPKPKESKDSKGETKSKSKSESKSESKPESKSESKSKPAAKSD